MHMLANSFLQIGIIDSTLLELCPMIHAYKSLSVNIIPEISNSSITHPNSLVIFGKTIGDEPFYCANVL